MSFSSLGLSEPLVRAVTEQGYRTPTPIQLKAIPAVLAGGDLLAGAQTGTGKTAGFVLPMLQQLSQPKAAPAGPRPSRKPLRALILTPTRELAAQVEASVRVYGKHLKLTSTIAIGGVGMSPQTAQLARGVDILVATPGRLLDHHGERNVDFSHVEIFVLDEADRMLDMGFIHDIKRVLALLPKRRQNLLFSATFSDEIRALAIHGNKSQSARTRALAEFKTGDLPVLVATDIAARGIDIDQLPHVVNYDLPNVPEDYVHRIGRTGRAGAAGEAVSLVCVDEHAFLRDIEKLIRKPIRREALAGFEPDPHAKPQPIVQRGGHNPRNARGTPRAGAGRGAAQPAQQTRARGNTQPAPRAQTRAAGQAPDRETARDPRRGQASAKRKR